MHGCSGLYTKRYTNITLPRERYICIMPSEWNRPKSKSIDNMSESLAVTSSGEQFSISKIFSEIFLTAQCSNFNFSLIKFLWWTEVHQGSVWYVSAILVSRWQGPAQSSATRTKAPWTRTTDQWKCCYLILALKKRHGRGLQIQAILLYQSPRRL